MEERKEVDQRAQTNINPLNTDKTSPTTCLLLGENRISMLTTHPHQIGILRCIFHINNANYLKLELQAVLKRAQILPRAIPSQRLKGKAVVSTYHEESERGFSGTDCSTEEYMSSLHPHRLLNDLLHIVLILHTNTYTPAHTRRATIYQLALTEVQLGWNNKDNGIFNHAHDKQQWANFPANNSWIINSTKRQSLTCRLCSGEFYPWFIKGVWHWTGAFKKKLPVTRAL